MERNNSFHIRKLSSMSPNKTRSQSLYRKTKKKVVEFGFICEKTSKPSGSPDRHRNKTSLYNIVNSKHSYLE